MDILFVLCFFFVLCFLVFSQLVAMPSRQKRMRRGTNPPPPEDSESGGVGSNPAKSDSANSSVVSLGSVTLHAEKLQLTRTYNEGTN